MSKAEVDILIDNRFPNNTQQLIKPVDARVVTKRLNEETYNFDDNDSDDINEGSINLFFTNERVDDRMAQVLQPSSGGDITWSYDDTAGTITPVFSGSGGGGGGTEIVDSTKQAALLLNTNWGAALNYDTLMVTNASTVITGQAEHDYFYAETASGDSINTGSTYKYEIIKIGGTLSVIRIPLKLS